MRLDHLAAFRFIVPVSIMNYLMSKTTIVLP
jgi:hypothetical protein